MSARKKAKAGMRLEFFKPATDKALELPLYTERVPAGFPSPAEDYIDKKLDLNEHLIKNPAATFFVKVSGHSMIGAGIYDGDILVVDRSVEAADKKIIIGVVNGEFTVKRIRKKAGKIWLLPENEKYEAIEVNEEMDFRIWGVVTYAIHRL
jgi:DNA polymerase V